MADYACVGKECQRTVPIFPLRYSVHPKQSDYEKGLGHHADERMQKGSRTLPDEFRDSRFPSPAGDGVYDLRCIGDGFIYLFISDYEYKEPANEQRDVLVWQVNRENLGFTEIVKDSRFLDSAVLMEGLQKGSHESPFIWAPEDTTVYVLATDSLLTRAKVIEIKKKLYDRNSMTTQISLRTWNPEHPDTGTFSAEKLGEWVEEFKHRQTPKFFEFSPRQLSTVSTAKEVVDAMKNHYKNQKDAEIKLIAVVLSDPIALVEDTAGIIAQEIENLERYLKNPVLQRRLIVHGLIEQALKIDDTLRRRWTKHLNIRFYEEVEREHRHKEDSLRSKIERWKRFRAEWLKSYEKPDSGIYHKWRLHYRFQLYDKTHNLSANLHAMSFAKITELMLAPDDQVGHAESDLYAKWWSLPAAQNPFMVNMELDKGVLGPFKWDTLGDTIKTGMEQASILAWRHEATRHILEQARVYMVRRVGESVAKGHTPVQWKKDTIGKIEKKIQKLMGLATETDAAKFMHFVTQEYKQQNTGHFKIVKLTTDEVLAKLEEVTQMNPGALGSKATANTSQAPKGKKSPNIEKTGTLYDDTLEVLVWTDGKNDVNQLKYTANPFLQKAELGISYIVGLLSVMNLCFVMAELRPSKEKKEMFFDAAGALLAVGTAVNSALITIKSSNPERYAHLTASRLGKNLASITAMRYFGYGTAFVDGVSYGLKARKQFDADNPEAGGAYVASGAFLVVGGALLTSSGAILAGGSSAAVAVAGVPIGGWLAAAVILLGTGIAYAIVGENAEFTAIDYWMNASTFGQHKSLSGHPQSYPNLETEVQTFYNVLVGPKIEDTNWENAPELHLLLTVEYPLKGKGHSYSSQQTVDRFDEFYCTVSEEANSPQELESGGEMRIYKIRNLRKKSKEFSFPITFSYTPDTIGKKLSLRYVVRRSDKPILVF
jgi:hypothetical protein